MGIIYRVKRFLLKRELKKLKTMEQFQAYIEEKKPKIFLAYKARSQTKRIVFQTIIDHLKIDLKGKDLLDMGPAYGDFLDVSFENGAKRLDCTDIHPIFITYNKLKPHVANSYSFNNLTEYQKMPEKTYDIIWNYGALNADRFISIDEIKNIRMLLKSKTPYKRFIFTTNFLKRKNLNLEDWIKNIERLGKKGCTMIICPYWSHENKQRLVKDLENNFFTKTLTKLGYTMLKHIPKHNFDPEYPVTFYKKLE
jgi:hypothetical protein